MSGSILFYVFLGVTIIFIWWMTTWRAKMLKKEHGLLGELISSIQYNSGDATKLRQLAENRLSTELGSTDISHHRYNTEESAAYFVLEEFNSKFDNMKLISSYSFGTRGSQIAVYRILHEGVPVYMVLGLSPGFGDIKWTSDSLDLDVNVGSYTANEVRTILCVDGVDLLYKTGTSTFKKETIERILNKYKTYRETLMPNRITSYTLKHSNKEECFKVERQDQVFRNLDLSDEVLDASYPQVEISLAGEKRTAKGRRVILAISTLLANSSNVLLTGLTGQGKTGMLAAITRELNKSSEEITTYILRQLEPSQFGDLTSFLGNIPSTEKSVVILDDFGAIADKDSNSVVLSSFKQLLDGPTDWSHITFLVTSNVLKSELAPALIRIGRFDLIIELENLTNEQANKLAVVIANNAEKNKYKGRAFNRPQFVKNTKGKSKISIAEVWGYLKNLDVERILKNRINKILDGESTSPKPKQQASTTLVEKVIQPSSPQKPSKKEKFRFKGVKK